MSIAELIMTGTERASKSTDWVADSLAKIGDNVTKVLREREQSRQAQEMLPFLQQSMQESMKKAGEGKSGEAYSILMPFLTDPSVARNPFMMPALEAGIKMNQIAADDFLKKEQLRVQEGMYNQRSEYNTSLLGLRQDQATAKAEIDSRKLGIQEERLKLQREYYDAKDENEKARIDIQLQRLDLDEQKLDSSNYFQQQKLDAGQDTSFQQSYEGAAGIGGPRSAGTPLTSTDRTTIEQAAKDIANLERLPGETPQQPTGIPAMVTQTTETPTQPFTLESPAASFTQLGEKPYEPSEQVLQEFQKNVAKYDSASSKEKKKMNSERSIVYDNQDELKKDLPNLNTEQIGFTQVDAGVVDPELVGIKYLRNVEKGRNAQGKITGYEKNKGAAASIERLQTAFNLVNNRQDLRELYANAGGWQNVEIKSVPASKSDIENVSASFEVINKKNREQKVLVTEKDAGFLQSIEMVIPISNTDEMDRVYLKGQQPTAQSPAQQQMSREDQFKKAQELLGATAGSQAASKELSLEQRLSQKTSQATSAPTRTVTPQQQAQVAKSQAASKVSTLRSEKTKLERLIYDVARASGKSSLKRGLTENDPDVIAAKKRISEIDKELE
jgi:hypothetical protein